MKALTPPELQKINWLLTEMAFRWDRKRRKFIQDEHNGATVGLEMVRMRVGYGCFQRAVQIAIQRADKAYERRVGRR